MKLEQRLKKLEATTPPAQQDSWLSRDPLFIFLCEVGAERFTDPDEISSWVARMWYEPLDESLNERYEAQLKARNEEKIAQRHRKN